MTEKCALYGIESALRNSHIIPKFAFDYLKKTGGKFLRSYENPNQRIQDGPKSFLLSEKAEQEFSKRERWFANNIFYPYLAESKQSFDYDENMAYFIVSILWRVLLDQLKHPDISGNVDLKFLKDVESEWKKFLSNYNFPVNYNDLNIFLTDRIFSHNTDGIDVDLYMTRIIDATIVANAKKTKVAVYVKFLRFTIWAVVKGKPNECSDLKIKFDKGILNLPQELTDNFMGSFFYNRIKQIDNRPKPSKEQQDIIFKELHKNEEFFWHSDAGQSIKNDFNLKKRR